ncbi:MAG: hypothetical protein OXU64_06615 [Gemmatimonadota bacterium]|nr:hypothetical protein [Gemmatimonadota bacterium]
MARIVPVGVVAWDAAEAWHGWWWLARDEKVDGVDATARTLIRITRDQIRRWAGEFPADEARKLALAPGASIWSATSSRGIAFSRRREPA